MRVTSGWFRLVIACAVAIVTAFTFGRVAEAISLPVCTTDSQPGTIIQSAPCGIYGVLQTRTEASGAIFVRFMTHTPAGAPKGIIILLPGGLGGAGISGMPGMAPTSSGQNFLVRTAQLQAEHRYLALTVSRPLIGDNPMTPEFPDVSHDLYRVSSRHAFDIVSVLTQVIASNPSAYANLRVLLAGTSRGTLSGVAQSKLVSGILLSSPLTTGVVVPCGTPPCPPFFIGHPDVPNLQPASVTVPAHVMSHKEDTCEGTLPANARLLHEQFRSAGVSSRYDRLNRGFTLAGTGSPPINVCDALTFHGFLGIENKAVKEMTKRADGILKDLGRRFRGNRRPIAGAGAIPAGMFSIDLATLASDPDGDTLTFSLPYATSNRGATLVLSGTTVMYFPVMAGITDGFVYVAADGKGGISSAVVTVTVAP